ncbi:MAG: ABC transporter permease [Gammaproteobacteria bacterium]
MNINYLYKEFSSERKRITLTLIAIAWGTFATIVMLAVGHGIMISSLKTLDTLGSNVLSIQGGDISAYNRGPLAEPTISILPDDYENITHTIPGIIHHTPDYIIPSEFENNGLVVNKKIEGVNNQFSLIYKLSIQGRFIDILDLKNKKNVVVLGNNLSKIIFHNKSPIQSHIHINGDDFLVIGIVKSASDTNNIINNLAYIPATTFQTLYSPLNIDEVILQFKDSSSLIKAKTIITNIIAKHNQVSAADQSLIYLKDNLANVIKVQNFYKSLEFILGIIGFCTMCVASLGVISVIYLAIQNSISSIGIRLALGETLKSIALYYLYGGLTIVAIGNIIGSFFASIAIYSINLLLANISIITINKTQLSLSWPLVISILSLLLIIGLLSSTFSILQLRHISPVEALRHD